MSGWRASLCGHVGSLQIDVELEGERAPVALIGPNGSGKTSVLRMIAGLLTPRQAEIRVGERVLFSSREGIDLAVERRGLGYVPQGYALFPHLSVLDNVAFGLSTGGRRVDRAERHRIAREALRELESEHLETRMPQTLSGGERQRIALARALATRPALLLLDEPLAALDATARRSVRRFLATHLSNIGCPSLIVTHEPRDVLALDARVVVLSHGKVVRTGTLADLRRAPGDEFEAEFVGVIDDVEASAGEIDRG